MASQEPDFIKTIITAFYRERRRGAAPFAGRLGLWHDFGGGVDSRTGEFVEKPAELIEAEIIIGLCDRWKVLPSQVRAEGADVLRLLDVYHLGHRKEEGEGGETG